MWINFYLGLLEGEACHISGGCINTYLRNPICSTHSLAYKTFSHPMACEYIGKLIFGAYTLNANVPFLLVISYEMVADINVLCSCMWTRLLVSLIALSLSHSNGTFLNLIPKSLKVAFIQSTCAQQLPADMYSASVVDNATLFCFFDDHETSDLPNNWHVPRCSSFQPCIPHNDFASLSKLPFVPIGVLMALLSFMPNFFVTSRLLEARPAYIW